MKTFIVHYYFKGQAHLSKVEKVKATSSIKAKLKIEQRDKGNKVYEVYSLNSRIVGAPRR